MIVCVLNCVTNGKSITDKHYKWEKIAASTFMLSDRSVHSMFYIPWTVFTLNRPLLATMIIKHLQLDYSRKRKKKHITTLPSCCLSEFHACSTCIFVYFVLLLFVVVVATFCCTYLKCCIFTIPLKVAYCSRPTNARESIKLFEWPNIGKHSMILWSISLYGIFGYVIKVLQKLRFMVHFRRISHILRQIYGRFESWLEMYNMFWCGDFVPRRPRRGIRSHF